MFHIGNRWDEILAEEFNKDYCKQIQRQLEEERQSFNIYPAVDLVFAAFKAVDFSDVKVCILGQDPYHGKGQANGLAFAVNKGVPFPPSLANIFKELMHDTGCPMPSFGTLLGWAKQGVLLLNTSLSVRESQPLSHAGFGWDRLTDAAVCALAEREKPLVFILWGASAGKKSGIIPNRHLVIKSPHPSPLSAHSGFFGSKPFSRANKFLIDASLGAVDWARVNFEEDGLASYYLGAGKIVRI